MTLDTTKLLNIDATDPTALVATGTVIDSENALQGSIDNLGPNPTEAQMLLLQQQMGKYDVLVNLVSSLGKTFADAMKGIVQKI